MKRLYALITFILISISAFHCQREVSGDTLPVPGPDNRAPLTATLQGNVLNEVGQPAVGVTMKVGNKTAITDIRGYFRIVGAALDKESSMVSAEKTGYFKAYRTFSATSGVNQVVIKLIRKTMAGSIDAAAGGTVTVPDGDGSKIALPANGVIKATGGAYSGSINVYAAYIYPTMSDISTTIPGSFMADNASGDRVLLTSYGMMAVELESPSGEKLQIASGHTATLTTAIPDTLRSFAPAVIKMWYVDERTGIWQEEGSATKSGSKYVAEVKHFTYWNCDVATATVNLTATFKTSDGLPLAYTAINIKPAEGYSGYAHGYTDSAGQISGPVPANMHLTLEVADPCYNPIYTQDIGPYSGPANLGTVTVSNSMSSLTTIRGKLVSCNNTPVADGYAIIYHNNIKTVVHANSNGEFSMPFVNCSTVTCEVSGVDATAQQQSPAVSITIDYPVTDAGNITACGTSTIEFINYDLDGTNYSISSLHADSLIAYQQGAAPSFNLNFTGFNFGADEIHFDATTNGMAGTFPLGVLSVQNYDNTQVGSASSVTITNYPQTVGGYYEGNFSGTFTNNGSSPLHIITGSFRLRKNF